MLDRALKKYAMRCYQLKGYSHRNPGILVVWGTRADSHSYLYEMPKIEKKAKKQGRELGQYGISWQPRLLKTEKMAR